MKKYLKRTWKNKLCAIAMLLCGYVPMLTDKDATAMVFIAIFAIPMFFTKVDIFTEF